MSTFVWLLTCYLIDSEEICTIYASWNVFVKEDLECFGLKFIKKGLIRLECK